MRNGNQIVANKTVILNLIQDLQRLPLLNNMRGRFQIKFGMTALWNTRAFTLIELLVVVLIIGILAAVAVPQYQKAVTKSRYATLKNLTQSIAAAQEVYFLANGTYATAFNQLDIDMPGGKLDGSTDTTYLYDWGKCFLYTNSGYSSIYCKNEFIKMQYQIRLQHAKINPGIRLCVTETSNLINNRICKEETQQENPFYSDAATTEWKYK